MAAMGVPTGGRRNELDCRICDELDHVGLLRERLRPTFWKGGSGDGRIYYSACAPWFCCDADLLVHPVLDVPQEDLSKDLTRRPTLGEGSVTTPAKVIRAMRLRSARSRARSMD